MSVSASAVSASAVSASAVSASAVSASVSSSPLGSLVSSSGFDEEVEWRELKRFPGYRIYEDGRIRGKLGTFLKMALSSGYSAVCIVEKDKSSKTGIRTHRLIAMAFLDNPDPLTCTVVDHIDGVHTHNHRLNLQWISPSGNTAKADLSSNHNSAVRSYTVDYVFLKEYSSIANASRDTGVSQNMVSMCASKACTFSRNSNGVVYKWEYVNVRQKLLTEPEGIVIEGLDKYIILSSGRVYSKFLKSMMKEPLPNKDGYCRIGLVDNTGKKANYFLHRLVMEAYFGPSDLQVNHKDSVRTNNDISNLEYVTSAQNVQHSVDFGARGAKSRRVNQINLETLEVMSTYVSVTAAGRAHGISPDVIGKVCRKAYGKKTAAGFGWEFEDPDTDADENTEADDIQ